MKNVNLITSSRRLFFMMAMSAGMTLLPQELLAVQNSIQAVQQDNHVEGVVKDTNGEPIIGATVRVVGTKTATVTDFDGNFKLNAKSGQSLQITYVGCKPKTVKVSRGAINVVLEDDSQVLKDVQVVAYGVQKKVTVTGAISNIKGGELTKVPTGSINNMLSGVVPGLSSVQYSGEPGADAATILVRGQATTNNSSPLIQVDGVERDFNDIDPSEIESITVLKDASATAVFGVRGANGVILVTTKRGKEGKAHISATTSMSVVMPTNMIKLANAYEYATYYNQMKKNDGVTDESAFFSPTVLQKLKDHSDPIKYPDTDWIDYCFKDHAIQTQHNVNISGGTERMRYFVSVGAFTQDGLFKQQALPYDFNYKYKRFNYRANLDFDVTKTTTISVNLGGRVDTKNTPYSGEDNNQLFRHLYWATPFSSPGIVNGKYVMASTDYDSDNMPFIGASGLGAYYGLGYMSRNTNTLNADVVLNQKLDMITKGLSFKLKGSYNSDYSVTKQRGAKAAYYTPVSQPDGSLEYRKHGNDTQLGYSEDFGKGRNWYFETSLNYNRNFGLHHVGALALYNQSKTYYPSTYSSIPSGYVGLVGRVTYDWNNRYMAEFIVGYNGSENFAPGKRYGTFPAMSVGWVVSDEPFFMPLTKAVSFLKLRASYGLVGNANLNGNRFMYTADPFAINNGNVSTRDGYGYIFGVNNTTVWKGAYEMARHNADITWEHAYKQDYGIDINFLKDKLRGNFDYYYEHRTDIMMIDNNVPTIIGYKMPYTNDGEVNSWGWEASLKWQDKIGKNFRYWAGVNLSYNQNELINNGEALQPEAYQMAKGHRLGARKMYQFWRYYDEQTPALYEKTFGEKFPTQLVENIQPGDAVYVDLNHDGKIDQNDMTRDLGYTDDPEYMIGLNLGFSYKGWSVNTQWTGAWNVSRMLDGVFRSPFYNKTSHEMGGLLKYVVENSWTADNPSQSAKYPRTSLDSWDNNYATSTLYEKDAKYLRLKTLQISYDFNAPFMKRIGMNQLQLAFSGYNLLTFTPYIWGDPEARATTAPSYPLQRTYMLSLKVGF